MVVLEYIENAAGEVIRTTAYSENTAFTSEGIPFFTLSETTYSMEHAPFDVLFLPVIIPRQKERSNKTITTGVRR